MRQYNNVISKFLTTCLGSKRPWPLCQYMTLYFCTTQWRDRTESLDRLDDGYGILFSGQKLSGNRHGYQPD